MELLSTISIWDKENKKAIIDGIEEYYREDKEKDLKIRFFEKELFGVAGVLYCDDMFFSLASRRRMIMNDVYYGWTIYRYNR